MARDTTVLCPLDQKDRRCGEGEAPVSEELCSELLEFCCKENVLSGFWNRERRRCSMVRGSDLGNGADPSASVFDTALAVGGRPVLVHTGSSEQLPTFTSVLDKISETATAPPPPAFLVDPLASGEHVLGIYASTTWVAQVFTSGLCSLGECRGVDVSVLTGKAGRTSTRDEELSEAAEEECFLDSEGVLGTGESVEEE